MSKKTAPRPGRKLKNFKTAKAAVNELERLYEQSCDFLRQSLKDYADGNVPDKKVQVFYPRIRIDVERTGRVDKRAAYGYVSSPAIYEATVTRPDIYRDYLMAQLDSLIKNHEISIQTGVSDEPIPVDYALGEEFYLGNGLSHEQRQGLKHHFDIPDLTGVDENIINGEPVPQDQAMPLAHFSAQRTDFSLQRMKHYTGTSPTHFQNFVIFTNYKDYMDEFRDMAMELLSKAPKEDRTEDHERYLALVEPGNVISTNENIENISELFNAASGEPPRRDPQMPTYHLIGKDGRSGITIVNIGVGPSNAKNITDHIAVLRPHAWMMLGHCAGLRNTQELGDYVLANGYLRKDKILDDVINPGTPIPPLAEIQTALSDAITEVTKVTDDYERKDVVRTGTVVTELDRNWETRPNDMLMREMNENRAIALDMESATIAANGYRFRVPYGTLLCVSDKPFHGAMKLPGMADSFYRKRVKQHFRVGVRTMQMLADSDIKRLHSRKLRSFMEPAFR